MTNRHFLLHKKLGATLVELMMMLLVISLALSTMFYTLTQTISFARDTEARIKAVALAREGIEAMINIRNTNWLRFSSDRKNCWDVLDYDSSCIGGAAIPSKISDGQYILYQEFSDGLWRLEPSSSNYSDYSEKIILNDGWYQASTKSEISSLSLCKNIADMNPSQKCMTPFSRIIKISLKTDNYLEVISEVSWNFGAKRSVALSMKLTNWKSYYDQNNP